MYLSVDKRFGLGGYLQPGGFLNRTFPTFPTFPPVRSGNSVHSITVPTKRASVNFPYFVVPQKATGGCVSNDFLRLLMMGTPSDELQAFLLHDLTDKVHIYNKITHFEL